MTAIGKLLVFLNVALCVVLLTWAIALYTQRVDWSSEGSGTAPKGEITKLRDKLQPRGGWGLLNELQAAESRFQTAWTGLAALDLVQVRNNKWYLEQLNLLTTSPGPVQALVYQNGLIALTPQGLPQQAPAKDSADRDLNGYDFYVGKIQDTETQIKSTQDMIAELILKDEAVTKAIAGDKSVRYWIGVEKVKKDGITEEIEYLLPLLYNTAVEKELVLRRFKDLTERKGELEKARLATR